jgi:predicted MFS family arabinose efflux permease
MADRFAVAPLLIPMARTLHVSLAAVSGAASLYYLAYGLLPPLYGVLSDRFGRVRVMRMALAGTAAADVLSAISPNLPFLLTARFLTGAIACGVFPTTLVYIGDRVPFTVRQQAIARVLTFVAIGTAGGTLGAGLTANFLNWRLFFFFPAVIAALVALGLARVPESLPARSTESPIRQLIIILRNRWALLVLVLGLLVGAVMFGFATYFAPSLEARGQTAAVAGTVVATYGVSVLVCTRLFAAVARRFAIPFILAGGATMLVLAYVIASTLQTLPTILLASILTGGAYAFMQSTFQTWATDIVPEARGTSTALFATTIFTGAALATAAVAGLASSHQYSLLFAVAAAVTIPVLIGGTLGRWRYAGSRDVAGPAGQIG